VQENAHTDIVSQACPQLLHALKPAEAEAQSMCAPINIISSAAHKRATHDKRHTTVALFSCLCGSVAPHHKDIAHFATTRTSVGMLCSHTRRYTTEHIRNTVALLPSYGPLGITPYPHTETSSKFNNEMLGGTCMLFAVNKEWRKRYTQAKAGRFTSKGYKQCPKLLQCP
jgi:hypothetical protein